MKVRWTAHSHARLTEIFEYVARDDVDAADRLVARLVDRGEAIGRFPNSGRRVPELPASGLREIVEGNYRLVYRIRSGRVEILTVFEGHRLLRRRDVE